MTYLSGAYEWRFEVIFFLKFVALYYKFCYICIIDGGLYLRSIL